MDITTSFGYWVRRRRKALDLTQRALADRVGCSVVTVKKIEADERLPSQQMAERFADMLALPLEERAIFLARARGLLVPNESLPAVDSSFLIASVSLAPLPIEQTPFVGRVAELQQFATLLADPSCRLLTLVGPGGVGKTRLMLRAAATFAHAVCFVPLAEVAAAEQIAPSIAARLGLHHTGTQDIEQALLTFLRHRELLLILDNVEHLLVGDQTTVDALPNLVSHLLDACPLVKLLVSSREQLNLQAEWLFPVTGLEAEDARALFVGRAQRVQPSFTVAAQEHIVDDICRLVEGMPLAIELVANWTPFLSCAQIKQQLEHDNDLLASRLRDVPERHRSLSALFDQSWQLLTNDERRLFARLSVFRGGFTTESMREVCGAHLETLLTLVEKSLVASDGAGRYSLHELARRYAAEQLKTMDATAEVRENHCNAYLALAETAAAHFAGPLALQWFERIHQEQDNLRAALQWALHQPDTTVLYRLAQPLTRYWYAQGHWQEGVTWLQAILVRTADSVGPARAAALCWYGIMLVRSGHEAEAIPYFTDGYALAQQTEDATALGLASLVMASLDRDGEAPQRYYRAATELFRQAHDDELLAMALYFWGDDLRMQHAIPAARAAYVESLQLYRSMGNLMYIAYPLGNLGRLALLEGDTATAQQHFAESVAYSRRNGNGISLIDWLVRLGTTAVYRADSSAARIALLEAYSLANDLAYQSIFPHIGAWLALTEGMSGNSRQAMEYLQQSLEGYVRGFAAVAQGEGRDGSYLSRFDALDALAAAAYLHRALAQLERAVVVVSGIEQVSRKHGYHLDQPLQAIVDSVRSTCKTSLEPTRYKALWEQGQGVRVDELLRLAAVIGPLEWCCS
jgi:predicted ATPase/transcriptional regulator with XRE-family HTH domain